MKVGPFSQGAFLGAVLALTTAGSVRAVETVMRSEGDPKVQIQALLVSSPYRISPSARQGAIRYRLSAPGANAWSWPETGEQRVSQVDGVIELTVCETCGREAAPTEAELARHLVPNRWLDSRDREVVAFARSVRGGSTDTRMRRLVTAVQARLSGPVSFGEYATARQALDLRGGDCTEYALLLAAAGRARGIPTRVVAGLAYGSRFAGKPHVFGPHMWVQAWNGKRWVSYDAGLGSFDAGHLAIAIGDGSPESLQGALRLISSLRIVDAEGFRQASTTSATRP